MIRKFSVTHSHATEEPKFCTDISAENKDSDEQKLYANSLESTENSLINGQTNGQMDKLKILDPLLYPIGSDQPSTDEGLSMSEADSLPAETDDLTKMLSDLDIDHRLASAAQKGDTIKVRELLASGAQVTTDETGTTALHIAAQNGFAEVVRLLLEHGTDVDYPDSGGYTALNKAAACGHLDVLELLINEGCDIDPQDDLYGNTPLHEAAWNGYSKTVDLLLKSKSNSYVTNRAGCTALHLAAQNGHNQSGRTLLYAGCSPDVKNNYGDTPLHTASRYGHAGIARILISAKCSIDEQNKNGDTALHITAAFKRRKIAKLLVDAGINKLIRNKQNETAVDIARRKEHPQIIDIIHDPSHTPAHPKSRQGDHRRHHEQLHHHHHHEKQTVQPVKEGKEKKKPNAFVTWIRKHFAKDKKNRETRTSSHAPGSQDDGLFSTYVKKPGFAYYRDLAGNIRQGPCGFVPACGCDTQVTGPEVVNRVKETTYTKLQEAQRQLQQRMEELRQQVHADDKPDSGRHSEQERGDLEHERDSLELNRQLAQVENDLQDLRGDLQTWLVAQDGAEYLDNPFAYAVGQKQTRFGDDFDGERLGKCEVTEQFPPPPRLFRSRSDETLSHSEYSYHGRAFKSREAAMEELKILKHHEELRAQRKKIRAGGLTGPITTNAEPPKMVTHKLWQSRENLSIREKTKSIDNLDRGHETLDGQSRWQPGIAPTSGHSAAKLKTANGDVRIVDGAENKTFHSQTVETSARHLHPTNAPNGTAQHNYTQFTVQASSHTLPFNRYQPQLNGDQSKNRQSGNGTSNSGQMRESWNNQRAGHKLNGHANQSTTNSTTPVQVQVLQTSRQTNVTVNGQSVQRRSDIGVWTKDPGQSGSQMLYSENRPNPSVIARQSLGNVPLRTNQMVRQSLPQSQTSAPLVVHSARPVSSQQLYTDRRSWGQPPKLPLPSYEQTQGHASGTTTSQLTNFPSRPTQPSHTILSSRQTAGKAQSVSQVGIKTDPQTGDSSCGGSNPDSGYGGHSYDYYSGQPSPNNPQASHASKEYDSWYNRRLQDAAIRINARSGRAASTHQMTSDV